MLTDESIREAIHRLRESGKDDDRCEAKSCERSLGESVWDSVSAFANTSGGLLLLGLDERRHFQPVKGFSPDRISRQFFEGMGDGSRAGQKVFPAPRHQLHEYTDDGNRILAIEIQELAAEDKPCRVEIQGIERGSYRRSGDRDVRLTATEIYEMQSIQKPSDADLKSVKDADVSDLDPKDVRRLIAQVESSGSRAFEGCETDIQRLTRLHALTKDGLVTLGGLLCMGFYPQQFFPSIVIDVAVHPGTTKGSNPDVLFLDRHVCDGSMPEAIEDALQTIFKNLRTRAFIQGSERIERTELPIEVVREALVNAVIHREYAPLFLGQPIQVDVFSDRVEIRNPGGLWGGVSPENLGDGISRCRNQGLLRLMREFTNPDAKGPFVEGNGTGIHAMRSRMKREGLPGPLFNVSIDQFVVVLERPALGLGIPMEVTAQKAAAQLSNAEALSDATAIMASQAVREASELADSRAFREAAEIADSRAFREATELATSISSSQQAILDSIGSVGVTNIQQLSDMLGKSAKTLRPQLKALVDKGLIAPTAAPTSRKRQYRLADDARSH